MNNSLHRLIDSIKSKKTLHILNNKKVIQQVELGTLISSKHAVCFNIGSAEDVEHLQIIRELIRHPFDVCWYEYSLGPQLRKTKSGQAVRFDKLCFLSKNLNENICVISCWSPVNNFWCLVFRVVVDNKDYKIQLLDEDMTIDEATQYLKPLFCFLSALNCKNTSTTEHKPSKKLNSARVKRGKPPILSTWTLTLDIPKSTNSKTKQGGTHSSPRVHLRRGHVRQYAKGKYCWVQPCAVGNREKGMICKDYAAKYGAPKQPN